MQQKVRKKKRPVLMLMQEERALVLKFFTKTKAFVLIKLFLQKKEWIQFFKKMTKTSF